MLQIEETEEKNVYDFMGKMDDSHFHIFIDDGKNQMSDDEMSDKNGDPMVWSDLGNNWFEKSLIGYANCYDKVTDEIVTKIKKGQYKDAINLLGINNIVAFYEADWVGRIFFKDYCFCENKFLEKFHTNDSFIAKNENSKQCEEWC